MLGGSIHPGSRVTAVYRVGMAAVLFAACATATPVSAQSLQEVKDALQMMVSSAAICSDYLTRPEVLEQTRQIGQSELTKAGMSLAQADAFMDEAAAGARAETRDETQKRTACEMVNIRAIE